jgi:predicted PurR-regulated permease PerM
MLLERERFFRVAVKIAPDGDEVDLNPWATVVSVVGFGLVWGIIGAVLALPLIGMFRILCTHFSGLREIGYLLGRAAD